MRAAAARAAITLVRPNVILAAVLPRRDSRRRDLDINVLPKGRNLDRAMAIAVTGM